MDKSYRKWSLILAVTLALGFVGWRGFSGSQASAAEDGESGDRRLLSVAVREVVVESGYETHDRFVGEIEAARLSHLGFELPGTVLKLKVDEGDKVEAGQVLAELDTARLEASRREQNALVDQADARIKLERANFERFERSVESGAVSKRELDESIQRRDIANAALERAQAALASIDVDLEKSRLVAPYAGRIAARKLDEGAIVRQGEVVFELIESSVLEARIGITNDAANRFNTGDRIDLRDARTGELVSATVRQVSPRQDRRTRTVDVLVTIQNSGNMVSGDLVEWRIPATVEANGSWLPRSALTSSARGLWAAYVAVESETENVQRLERRELEVLHLDEDRVFVRGALREGDAVVTDGLQRLVPGQHVVIADPEALAKR